MAGINTQRELPCHSYLQVKQRICMYIPGLLSKDNAYIDAKKWFSSGYSIYARLKQKSNVQHMPTEPASHREHLPEQTGANKLRTAQAADKISMVGSFSCSSESAWCHTESCKA
jgi:hypothetical protein